jgi:DNA segregation ATPase FtsK/SpoIIIE-like protein
MSEYEEHIKQQIEAVLANQQSLHDDIASVVERLTSLELAINESTKHSSDSLIIAEDQLYTAARSLVVEVGKASTSLIQKVLRVGYSRAANLIDLLEANGVISSADGVNPRTTLINEAQLEDIEDSEMKDDDDDEKPTDDTDDLYEEAKAAVIEAGKASTPYIQRKLRIGYSRAARLMVLLEERKIIGPANGAHPRDIISKGK